MCKLFATPADDDVSVTQKPKRLKRTSAREMKDQRMHPQHVLHFNVRGHDIDCVAPVHPRDDLVVKLDAKMIEHTVMLIRSSITYDDLVTKRKYSTHASDESAVPIEKGVGPE